MKTIYIKGIKQYKYYIRRGLEKSKLVEGKDYIIGNATNEYALVWIREDLDLRELKLAISAKYVWRNRMRFFLSIDEMNPKQSNDLTLEDVELMNEIKNNLKHESYQTS